MHEMSIALSIIDIATKEAQKAGSDKITEIELEIGTLSGVEIEAMKFAMEFAVKNTLLENATVKIHEIPARFRCKTCMREFESDDQFSVCPDCNSYDQDIITGKELRVKSLVVE